MAVYSVTCIIFTFVSLCSVVVTSEENIPIIAWSNSKSLADVAPFAQQTLYTSVNSIAYKKEKIFVFSQSKMSFDDLAKYGGLYGSEGALKNIENYVSASESSVILSLPYQPDFVNFLVNELSFLYDKGRVQYFSAEDVMSNDGEFVNSDCRICVISLPETPSLRASDQASYFAENDKFIASVMGKDVVQRDKYIAMFTAKYSQMHTREQSTLLRSARQAPNNNTNSTCAPISYCFDNETVRNGESETDLSCYFYMRLQEIAISFNRTWNGTITNETDTSEQICEIEYVPVNNTNETINAADYHYRTITVVYLDVKPPNTTVDGVNITIKYRLPLNHTKLALPTGFWTIELNIAGIPGLAQNVTLKYKEEGLPPYPLAIPEGASFHCSNATYCVEDEKDRSRCNSQMPTAVIRRLQVEWFNNNTGLKKDFDIAYDCESYFTSTTWMGIFTLTILLPILIIGLFLVMQTQTMDRFDDPREPAIVMTVTD